VIAQSVAAVGRKFAVMVRLQLAMTGAIGHKNALPRQ
jgi:hypothetical protein